MGTPGEHSTLLHHSTSHELYICKTWATVVPKWRDLVVWQNFSWGGLLIYLLQIGSPGQSKVQTLTKSHVVNHWVYWGYLQENGWGITLTGQNRFKDSYSTKGHSGWITSHKAGNLHNLQQLNRLENALFWCFSWSEPLPSSLACFCLFQVWESLWLGSLLSEGRISFYCLL